MKVIFCIPAMNGLTVRCHQSLIGAYSELSRAGIPFDEFFIEACPYLPVARNTLAAMFLADPEATDLFFVDADLGFQPEAVLRILGKEEPVVAGIYPLKRDDLGFPAKLRFSEDRLPLGRNGLLEAELLPTGFMRIKRHVFEIIAEKHPELRYSESVVAVIGEGKNLKEAWDFFGMGANNHRYTTEDFAFCERWRAIGGTVWADPNITFQHVGMKAYTANYDSYLRQLPGGIDDPSGLNLEARDIPGYMKISELIWLARQAKQHERIVEIGSYLGRSTRVLADNTQGTVWAVDNWQGPPVAQDAEDIFRANLADHIASGRVIVCKTDHADFEPYKPDMIFVDGSHDYDSVERDIRNALLRLTPGGLLCGHDADWPGVNQAVSELLPGADVVSGTSLWHYTTPKAKEETHVPETVMAS